MIQVQRFRHATEQERRLGRGPMVARTATLDIAKSEAFRRLRKAAEAGRIGYDALIALDGGRPVTKAAMLAAGFTEAEMRRATVEEEFDPILANEDLRRSQVESGDMSEFTALTLVREEYRTDHKPWAGPLVKSERQVLIESVPELRERLLKARAEGNPGVRDTDVAMLDEGRVREGALFAVFPGYELADAADALPGPLSKAVSNSRRVLEEAAADLRRLVGEAGRTR